MTWKTIRHSCSSIRITSFDGALGEYSRSRNNTNRRVTMNKRFYGMICLGSRRYVDRLYHFPGLSWLISIQDYAELFSMSSSTSTAFANSRAFVTLSEAIAGYYCNILFYLRLRDSGSSKTTDEMSGFEIELRQHAVSRVLEICSTLYNKNQFQPTLGFAWYLLIAGLETKSLIHRQWVADRLKEFGPSWESCRWVNEALSAMERPDTAECHQGAGQQAARSTNQPLSRNSNYSNSDQMSGCSTIELIQVLPCYSFWILNWPSSLVFATCGPPQNSLE